MGNTIDKCKLLTHREIVSEKSFRAICMAVDYLKINAHNINIFRDNGYRGHVRQVAAYLASGHENFHSALLHRSPVEIAGGLQYYLLRLSKPLVPLYIQDLALDSNGDIQPEIVAADMLGLIHQDLHGRHIILVAILLDLLHFLKNGLDTNNELAGSDIPMTLLPVFFNLQPQHLVKWRVIAAIFMEMISLSPLYLPIHRRVVEAEVNNFLENRSPRENTVMRDLNLHPEDVFEEEDDLILHQVLIRNGSEGDVNFAEIVNIRILRDRNDPKMLNPIFGYFNKRFI